MLSKSSSWNGIFRGNGRGQINISKPWHNSLLCSLDSGTCETYRAVKGKDYFDVVVKNLSEYIQLVNQVLLKMILRATNIKDVGKFLSASRKLQLKQAFYDIDCTQDMDEVPDELIEALANLMTVG